MALNLKMHIKFKWIIIFLNKQGKYFIIDKTFEPSP